MKAKIPAPKCKRCLAYLPHDGSYPALTVTAKFCPNCGKKVPR